jgi:hypothetical protein
MFEERRKFPRFKIRQMIGLSFGRESYFQAEGLNISETGFLCQSSDKIEPCTRVYLMISLPVNNCENQEMECEGVVLRSVEQNGGFRIDVSFTSLQGEDRERLRSYIKRTLPLEGSVKGGNR